MSSLKLLFLNLNSSCIFFREQIPRIQLPSISGVIGSGGLGGGYRICTEKWDEYEKLSNTLDSW